MKRTKIVCTMGPKTENVELLKEMIKSGMNVARFNFSHGSHEEHAGRMALVEEARKAVNIPVATMLDTKGPEIRTGSVPGDKKVTLVEGQDFDLTIDQSVETTQKSASITYEGLVADAEIGCRILIDDGLIELKVISKEENVLHCTVVNGGELGSKKGVNVPNVKINLPGITEKDKKDILFGIDQGFDFVAASFVRNAACIEEIRDILNIHGSRMRIIAKIESAEGIENIDEILQAADGIMVARGDLGVEIPAELVPHIQKTIIDKMFGRIIAERISSNETSTGFTYTHYLEVSAKYLFADKTPDIFTRHLQENYLNTLKTLLTEARTSSFSVLFSPTVSEHLTRIREQLTTNPSTWNNYLKNKIQ